MALADPLALAREHMAPWKHLPATTPLVSQKISGGLTNVLTKVSIDAEALAALDEEARTAALPHTVLVRQFGIGTDQLIDRAAERVIFEHLGAKNLAPKLYGYFEGGRLEEFIVSETCTTRDLHDPATSTAIAALVAQLHTEDIAIEKSCDYGAALLNWWCLAEAAVPDMPTPALATAVRQFDMAAIKSQVEYLCSVIDALGCPVCFTHNDLLAGNILKRPDGSVVIVDYEYGAYSYRGFDFGNHFAEAMIHYDVDNYPCFYVNPDDYPSQSLQQAFFTAYLEATGETVTDEAIAALIGEARVFALASHLQWGMWAIVQAASSTIEFGFLEFAAARFTQYHAQKRKWGV